MNVSRLFIYPVKSCRGIAVDRAELGLAGLSHDRRWMVTRADGSFVTQRELPRMALIEVTLSDGEIELACAGFGCTRLPARYDGPRCPVRVWSDQVQGVAHQTASRWVSAALGGEYRLVYLPDDGLRSVNPARARPGDVVGFADAYPLLVVTEASLADLVARLPEPIGVERFRPNLVVSGGEPYAEDRWRRIRVAGVEFRVPKACDRCTIPAIDPVTGRRGTEPLRTLASYRKWDGKVWFGVNLIPDVPGALAVGDQLSVIE